MLTAAAAVAAVALVGVAAYRVAMSEALTGAQIHAADLPDWRLLVGRLEATFGCPSYAAAGGLAAAVAARADEFDHHPTIDVRYPGVVHVTTSSHDSRGVTDRDVHLARAVSALARDHGASSMPLASMTVEIAIDALDIDAVRPFWAAVCGYQDEPAAAGEPVCEVRDPRGIGPTIWFQQMSEPRPQRNRIHLDVVVPHDLATERVEAALAAGGQLVSAARAQAFWVLADPEGNEACVCTWLDHED